MVLIRGYMKARIEILEHGFEGMFFMREKMEKNLEQDKIECADCLL
jgi:hypothetical protein